MKYSCLFILLFSCMNAEKPKKSPDKVLMKDVLLKKETKIVNGKSETPIKDICVDKVKELCGSVLADLNQAKSCLEKNLDLFSSGCRKRVQGKINQVKCDQEAKNLCAPTLSLKIRRQCFMQKAKEFSPVCAKPLVKAVHRLSCQMEILGKCEFELNVNSEAIKCIKNNMKTFPKPCLGGAESILIKLNKFEEFCGREVKRHCPMSLEDLKKNPKAKEEQTACLAEKEKLFGEMCTSYLQYGEKKKD